MEIIYLIFSLIALWLGAHLIINGALAIGEHYKISQVFLGLTVVALGTDLPEAFIAISGGISRYYGVETSGLVVGQNLGSAVGQITLMLGIIGLFGVLKVTKREFFRDSSMFVISVLLLFLVAFDGVITAAEGITLVLIYFFYFFLLIREEKIREKFKVTKSFNLLWAIVSLAGGFAILMFASEITIDNALIISTKWGIPQFIIGALIVGLGTSLPELITALVAIKKRANGLALGNLLGSTIFDVIFVIGIGSVIKRTNINQGLVLFDIPFLFLVSLVILMLIGKERTISKKESAFLILLYAFYFVFQILRA